MKKIYLILIITLFLTGCFNNLTDSDIPKGYTEKEEYYDKDGVQDYTDYAKYIYESKDIIENNKDYNKVTTDDINNITEYFNDFRSVMESKDRLKEYDFDVTKITEGDFFRIKTKEGESIGDSKYEKFDNYTLYFFDTETLTLYYIHNNI